MTTVCVILALMILVMAWGLISEKTLSSPIRLLTLGLGICVLSAMDIALMDVITLLPKKVLDGIGDNPERVAIVKAFLNIVLATTAGGMFFLAFAQRAKQFHVKGISDLHTEIEVNERLITSDKQLLKKAGRAKNQEQLKARIELASKIADLEEEIEDIRSEISRRQGYN